MTIARTITVLTYVTTGLFLGFLVVAGIGGAMGSRHRAVVRRLSIAKAGGREH
jgi:hypothetical protein